MPASLRQIREAMAAVLDDALENVTVSGYMLANPTPPCIEMRCGPIELHKAFQDGLDTFRLIVRVYVASSLTDGAQLQLDRFREPGDELNIQRALEVDPELGGLVQDITVRGITEDTTYVMAGRATLFGAEWSVDVNVDG
jgi:hypothetical protein